MRKKCETIRFIIPALIIFSIFAGSCSGRKSRAEKKDLIAENDLVEILAEIHLADGLLTIPRIRYLVSGKDSLSGFIDAIGKHGYKMDEVEKTLRYYFIKKPKKLIKIYDLVLGRLSEMESRYLNEASQARMRMENVWPGHHSYFRPDPFDDSPAELDLEIKATGYFTFNFSLTIYPDDQSVDPVPGLYLYYPGKPDSLQRDYISTFRFIKDGRPHNYTISKFISGRPSLYLRGWFVDYQNQHPGIQRHVTVGNITFLGTRVK